MTQSAIRRQWSAFVAALRRLFGFRSATSDWEQTWTERQSALEKLFGAASDHVLHAVVPFYLDGQADVMMFKEHIIGATLYVTADLTGADSGQVSNGVWDQYELAICVRRDDHWPPNTISRLATYCLDTPLKPGETMDIASAVPQPSTIRAFVFCDYGTFRLHRRRCGVLLCLGITEAELQECFDQGSTAVLERLRGEGIYPFTDLQRETSGGSVA
jgi:suppressor of fused protein SUFU